MLVPKEQKTVAVFPEDSSVGLNFSVIIPSKNEEKNIGRCLESIFSVCWDRADFEILLVDNGSHDHTVEIARSFGVTSYIIPDCTIAKLRNFGASKARGKILVFLDADCTVDSAWLQAAARYISERDIACFGSPPVVPINATWVQDAWFHVRRKKNGIGETNWLESMNMFVRREFFEQVAGFNEDLITCEDYDLSFRLKQVGRLVTDERIIAVHHGEATSAVIFFKKEFWRGISNLKGISSHGFSIKELPSLISPIIYGISAIAIFVSVLVSLFGFSDLRYATGLIIIWQMPVVILAIWKAGPTRCLLTFFQLYLLFLIYFIARAAAVLPRRRQI